MQLTPSDIQKISLYIPFNVKFSPRPVISMLSTYTAKGVIGSTVIERWDEDEGGLCDYADISHPLNSDLPVLRRLSDMTTAEQDELSKLMRLRVTASVETLSANILCSAATDIWLYALEKHFDLFGLIEKGAAYLKIK